MDATRYHQRCAIHQTGTIAQRRAEVANFLAANGCSMRGTPTPGGVLGRKSALWPEVMLILIGEQVAAGVSCVQRSHDAGDRTRTLNIQCGKQTYSRLGRRPLVRVSFAVRLWQFLYDLILFDRSTVSLRRMMHDDVNRFCRSVAA